MIKKAPTAFLIIMFILFILVAMLLAIFPLFTTNSDYDGAKTEVLSLFNNKKEEFFSAVSTIIDNQPPATVVIKGVDTINYEANGVNVTIDFLVQAQGLLMTGGQYWGLYYTTENKPINVFGSELLPAPCEGCFYWRSEKRHDFYATEMLQEGWYYYYMDFDGNKHGLNW